MATVTAPRDVLVPDIGDFSDVPIIEVHVASGDAVQPEDPLVTLESDKATMDVPAPFAGIVEAVKVSVGDTISEGSLLMTVVPAEGDVAAETRVRAAPPEAAPQGLGSREQAVAAPPGAEPAAASRNPYAGPRARRLARELGVDLSQLTGTGRKGRILDSDVRSFKERPAGVQKAAAADGAALGLIPWPHVDFEKFGPVERRPLTRIKKISGPNLARNWAMIPHVTVHEEADVTELEAFRKRTNDEHAKDEVKVTMAALLLKACVAALRRFPDFNSSLEGDELVVKTSCVNLPSEIADVGVPSSALRSDLAVRLLGDGGAEHPLGCGCVGHGARRRGDGYQEMVLQAAVAGRVVGGAGLPAAP
jgi:pyruvate dehydrogenase E2 component (dihydrolipoamide acetyltransferase)